MMMLGVEPTTPVVPSPISSSCDLDSCTISLATWCSTSCMHMNKPCTQDVTCQACHAVEDGGAVVGDGDLAVTRHQHFVHATWAQRRLQSVCHAPRRKNVRLPRVSWEGESGRAKPSAHPGR